MFLVFGLFFFVKSYYGSKFAFASFGVIRLFTLLSRIQLLYIFGGLGFEFVRNLLGFSFFIMFFENIEFLRFFMFLDSFLKMGSPKPNNSEWVLCDFCDELLFYFLKFSLVLLSILLHLDL